MVWDACHKKMIAVMIAICIGIHLYESMFFGVAIVRWPKANHLGALNWIRFRDS